MSSKSNITKQFYAILEYIKNNTNITKSISVKSHGSNIYLHPLIMKLPNAEKGVLKKEYRFDEAYNISD